MTDDPQRLRESGEARERELLDSSAADSPDHAARKRVAQAVALAAVAASSTSVTAASTTLATLAKWLGLAVGVVATGVAVSVARTPSRPQAAPPVVVAEVAEVVAPAIAPAIVPPAAPPVITPAAPHLAHHAAREPEAAPLQLELAALDGAQHALDNGEPTRALAALDGYHRQFAHGVLAPEAAVMRITCLLRLHDRAQAEVLAKRFFATYPKSPLRERVRALLREAQ